MRSAPRPPCPRFPRVALALLCAAASAVPAVAQIPGLPEGLAPGTPDENAPAAPAAVWAGEVGDRVTALAFAPDGATLAAGTFEEAALFDAATGEPGRTLRTRSGFVEALAWTDPDGLAVGEYGRVSRWDPTTGRRRRREPAPVKVRGYVTALAPAPGAGLLAGTEGGAVWRMGGDDPPAVLWPAEPPPGPPVPVRGLAVGPHAARVAVATGDPDRETTPGPTFLLTLAPAPGETAPTVTVAALPEHARAAECAAFSAGGGYVLTGGADETARLSALSETGGPIPVGRYAAHARPVNAAVALPSPDSAPAFATAGGGRAKGGNALRVWRFEPTESQAAAGEEGGDGPTGKVRDLAVIDDFAAPVRSLAVSPDGLALAVGDDAGAVRVYRVADLLGRPAPGTPAPPRPPLIAPKPVPKDTP